MSQLGPHSLVVEFWLVSQFIPVSLWGVVLHIGVRLC